MFRRSKAKGECGAVLQLGLVPLPEPGEAPPEEDSAVSSSGKAAGSADDQSAMACIKAQKQGYKMRESAMQKYNAGDAAGCLAMLNHADKIDPDAKDEAFAQSNRAMCELLVGKCAEGKRRYAAWLAKWGGPNASSPQQITNFAEQFSKGKCK